MQLFRLDLTRSRDQTIIRQEARNGGDLISNCGPEVMLAENYDLWNLFSSPFGLTCEADLSARVDDLTLERKEDERYTLRGGTAHERRHQTFWNQISN